MGERTTVEHLAELVGNLRAWIHAGHYTPGQRLIEADIMDRTGMPRARVREALRILESEGLVEIHRNRGAQVRRVSRAEVRDTLEVLRAVSAMMVEKAAMLSAQPEVRSRLEESLAKVEEFRRLTCEVEQSRRYMDENARFWDVFAAACNNPVLADTRLRLETSLFRLALEGARITSDKGRWIARHEELLTAVLAGDRALARQLSEEAVLAVEEAILALPDGAFSAGEIVRQNY
jgi:DNA-binding GntR family transcriptional regulator